MKKIIQILLLSLSIWMFTGCSTMNVPVKEMQQELTQDKTQSYISFARPFVPIGVAIPCSITQFDYEKQMSEFVGILYPGERILTKVTPGVHYYYLTGGENDDYIQVQTKAGHIYHVSTYVSVGFLVGRTYFSPLHQSSYSREDLEKIDLTQPNENAFEYYNSNLESYMEEILEDYPEWSKEEVKEKQILPEYGYPL